MKRNPFLPFLFSLLSSLFLLLTFLLASCAPAGPVTLTVMTHDSFAVSEDVVAAFEQANNVEIVFLAGGDTGEALNKAILSKNAPLADVFYGVDNTFLSRALEEGIFEAYESPLLATIPDEFELDPSHRALPVDFGDVCINYDKAWFAGRSLPVPQTLADLLAPEYRGLLVVENPATSSPGLAFLLATIAEYGDPGYLDFWADLRDNGVTVVDGWSTAYYTNFSGSSGRGPQPMVVSYASSPAAEFIFADPPVEEAPTASILGPGACYRQIEFVGILSGTQNRSLAEKFVDYMLDAPFQEDVPLQMFVYPVNSSAALLPEFIQWAQVAEQPAALDPALVAANRDEWIARWTEILLP
jgi:thiamine transport system substrate-binding protein